MDLPGDDRRYWLRRLRQLPIPVAPVHGELVVSYLRRLAAANHTDQGMLIRHLARNSSHDQMQYLPSHDLAINLTALTRLSLLSGHASSQLAKTLSITRLDASHEQPTRSWLPLAKERQLFRPCTHTQQNPTGRSTPRSAPTSSRPTTS